MTTSSAEYVDVYIGDYGNMTVSNCNPRWNEYRIPMDVWKRARRLFPSFDQREERMLYVDKWMYTHTEELNKGLFTREPVPNANPQL